MACDVVVTKTELDPFCPGVIDGLDDTGPWLHAGLGQQLLEDLRFGRVHGGRVDLGPDRFRVVVDAVGAAVASEHGAVLLA